jgi:hypothetical protein
VTAWLVALTEFGDLAVMMPLAAAMLIWLLLCSSREALRWVLALGFCVDSWPHRVIEDRLLWVSACRRLA